LLFTPKKKTKINVNIYGFQGERSLFGVYLKKEVYLESIIFVFMVKLKALYKGIDTALPKSMAFVTARGWSQNTQNRSMTWHRWTNRSIISYYFKLRSPL